MSATTKPSRIYNLLRKALSAMVKMLVVTLLSVTAVLAQDSAPANELNNIDVRVLAEGKIELQLQMTNDAPQPLTFTIDEPARIALDLPGTSSALSSRRQDVSKGALDTILVAEAGNRTRVVLNLDKLVAYQTRTEGNSIYVTLESGSKSQATSFSAAIQEDQAADIPNSDVAIESVDFRRTENGGGRVIVSLSDSSIPVDVSKDGSNVIVVFSQTSVPDRLLKEFDVVDFATPVKSVEAQRLQNDVRLVISANGPIQELAYQTDKVFTIEVQPLVSLEKSKTPGLFNPDREYTGERLTLNFQDIDTRSVLQLLADISGRNIVVSDAVTGNVTLRLQSVPWDQALDIVLATKGLDMRENGNVIIVAPADEIAQREKADLAAREEIKQLEPVYSEYLQVNYAKANDLAVLISGVGGGARSGGGSLLSDRGTVAIDERTNTLLLQDTSDRISEIRKLVSRLDIPVRQVLIESRIVVVGDDFSRSLGVRWGYTGYNRSTDGSKLSSVSGSGSATGSINDTYIENGNTVPDLPAQNDRYAVNLPVANAAGKVAMALLNDDYLVELELTALQSEGRGEVISSPRVITANQKEATIEQGVEIPYQEASSSGATTTQFKDALLRLTVTPQITPDDRIIMDLVVTKDSVGEVVSNSFGGSVPSIDTRKVQTQVLVNNGQTVVLGGIYETETGEFETKVPLLGDIPFLGYLFKSTKYESKKAELLIFVTPKIL
ncbi:MAG: type IV pilus secretin PilQ, partial [Gammaproteobacteria bacterium]|nr:type IV pilus secretin PilQ [Gammaproteobacteria bacterium]